MISNLRGSYLRIKTDVFVTTGGENTGSQA
jgi:hypothetical protein